MRHCGRSQTDQSKVLDDCCHVTSISGILRSKGHVITISIIKIRKPGLQQFLLKLCLDQSKKRGLVLVLVFQIGLYKLLE